MRRPFAALRTAALASGSALALVLAAGLPLASANPALAQAQPVRSLDSSVGGFNLASVNALLAKGDAAAASGNYTQARKDYDQPEVAVPLLVEVVKIMTPAREEGRKAYQSLVELGFVTTPYTAAGPTLN